MVWFHDISIALKLAYNRNKLFKSLYFWSRDMLNFHFLDKGLGIVSPLHFVYDFSAKMFLMLYSINWPNFIAWLPSLLEILGNYLLTRLWRHGFWNELYLSNWAVFSTWPKSHDKNSNILRTKRDFKVKYKAFLIIFKGFSVIKNCLRPYSAHLRYLIINTKIRFKSQIVKPNLYPC